MDENSRFVRTYVNGWMDEMMKAVVGVRFWKPQYVHHHLPGWMKTLTWL
jgi:hypothetical protein